MVFKEVFEYGPNRRKNQALLAPKKTAPWKLGLGFNNHLALLLHEDQRLEKQNKPKAKKLSKKEQADEAARNARSPVKRRETGKSRSIYPGAIGVSPSFAANITKRVNDEKQQKRQARQRMLAERGMMKSQVSDLLRSASDIGASTIARCGSDFGQESNTTGFYSGKDALNATLASPESPGHSKTVGWAPLEPVTEDGATGGEAAAVAHSKVPVAGDCAPAAIADAAVGDNSEMPNDESGQDTVDAAAGVAEGAAAEGVAVGCWLGDEPTSPGSMSNASVCRSRSLVLASVEAEATKTLQLVNGSPDSEHTSSELSAEGCWPPAVPDSGRFFERRRQRVPVEREGRRLGLQSHFMQARAAALGKVCPHETRERPQTSPEGMNRHRGSRRGLSQHAEAMRGMPRPKTSPVVLKRNYSRPASQQASRLRDLAVSKRRSSISQRSQLYQTL